VDDLKAHAVAVRLSVEELSDRGAWHRDAVQPAD
jgi:hypothetical protein